MPKTKKEADKEIQAMIDDFSDLINEEGARVLIEKEKGRDYLLPFYPSISDEFFSKKKSEKIMSQPLPQIQIADLLTGTRVGMLYGRITDIFVSDVKSKFANPPDSIVKVYKVKLIDETGEITYSDWCKKPGISRTYKVGLIMRFAHAKLKPSTNIDPNTGVLYPPNLTVEKSTVIELLNDDGTIIPKTASAPAPQAVAPVPYIPPVASSPVPAPFPVATPLSAPETEWMNVKAQYPTFYNAVDTLFGEIWKGLAKANQQPLITYFETNFVNLMDLIWGKQQ